MVFQPSAPDSMTTYWRIFKGFIKDIFGADIGILDNDSLEKELLDVKGRVDSLIRQAMQRLESANKTYTDAKLRYDNLTDLYQKAYEKREELFRIITTLPSFSTVAKQLSRRMEEIKLEKPDAKEVNEAQANLQQQEAEVQQLQTDASQLSDLNAYSNTAKASSTAYAATIGDMYKKYFKEE